MKKYRHYNITSQYKNILDTVNPVLACYSRTLKETAMPKQDKPKSSAPVAKYRRVEITSLDRGRRGKHHDRIQEILKELITVGTGSALEIPLADIDGIGLANLRSAVHRGATSAGLEIETLADEKNLYVWATTKK